MVVGKAAVIVALVLQIIIRYPYRERKRSQPDRQEQLLLVLLTVGGLIIPLIYIFTDWLALADYPASAWVVGLGLVVMAAGLWLFWRSHKDLGQNWFSTLVVHEQHTLVTRGVYRYVRHPMYAASWVMMLGQAPLLSNWIAGLSGLFAFGILYFARVEKEEAMMLEAFGEQYQQYMNETGRVIPKRLSA